MQDIEKKLSEITDDVEDMTVPDQVNHYILQGIDRGKRGQRRNHRIFYSSIAVVAAILIFFSSIRLSPAFASACVNNIPGMAYIVDLVQGDRGLEAAINNNFMQTLNLSQTKNGVTFTIDSMVADQNQMVLFYTIHRKNLSIAIHPNHYAFKNDKGESVEGSSDYDYTTDTKGKKTIHDRITVQFNNKQLTNPLHYSMSLAGVKWEFTIPFNIDQFKTMKKVYPVNQTVSMGGQKMTFNKVTVYPTRVAIDVTFDPNNTKPITRFEDLRLVDGNGNTWASINGLISSNISDNEWIVYLQSNYFSNPKSLYLKLNSARVINKNERKVVVDLNNDKLLKAPQDGRLQLEAIGKNNSSVTFTIKKPKSDAQNGVGAISSEFTDATGQIFHSNQYESWTGNDPVQHIKMDLPKGPYKSPLTFTIADYPTRIHGNISITLK